MIKAMKALYFVIFGATLVLLGVNTYGIITGNISGRNSTIMTMVIIGLAWAMITVKREVRSKEKEEVMRKQLERNMQEEAEERE